MIYKKNKLVMDYENDVMDLMFTKILFGEKEYESKKKAVFKERGI